MCGELTSARDTLKAGNKRRCLVGHSRDGGLVSLCTREPWRMQGTDKMAFTSQKKEPHIVWLFCQASELAQGRPAGLVATLLAEVLPP